MARPVLSDFLQDYSFWLFDVPTMESLALPIFTPLSGFSSITAPEVQFEEEAITEGNWFYKHKIIKRAEVNTITLTRGVALYNSDFYDWAMTALYGDNFSTSPVLGARVNRGTTPRRQLVLIHFLAHSPDAVAADPITTRSGVFDFALRVPARAYLLTGCIPMRYKSGSDFDATSGAISLSELDISYEFFEQFSLLGT